MGRKNPLAVNAVRFDLAGGGDLVILEPNRESASKDRLAGDALVAPWCIQEGSELLDGGAKIPDERLVAKCEATLGMTVLKGQKRLDVVYPIPGQTEYRVARRLLRVGVKPIIAQPEWACLECRSSKVWEVPEETASKSLATCVPSDLSHHLLACSARRRSA